MPFPTSPTNNQTYNDGTYTYRYSSTFRTWTKIAQTISNVSNVVTSNSNITTGNTTITGSNLAIGNTVVSSANIAVGNTVVSSANVTVGNTIISNNELTGNLANGNTSISIPSANGNVAFSAGGTSNVFVVAPTGTNITGTANISGNITSGNISTAGVLSVTGNANVGNLGTTSLVVTGTSTFTANIDMGNAYINNLGNPVASSDAATKAYVDSVAEGLHVHDSCYVGTTGTLDAASSGTVSYNNGTNGVGATLTTTGTYTTIDGGNVQTVGTRILVKNEANAAWNGVYVYTSSTVLTRAVDYNTTAEAAGGDFLFITSGSTQADTGWVQTTDNPVLGTDPIVFTQFTSAGSYQAGTGLTLTGTTFSVNASQTQITSVGTLSDLTVSGNIGVGNVTATGNISAANFVGIFANGNSDIRIPTANGNINIDVGGSTDEVVITSTGVNVAGYLTVTGNITGANLTSTRIITRTANNGATLSGTITPTADTVDQFNLIGINGSTTIAIPSGTPTDGQKLTIRIKDSGSAQTLTWTTTSGGYRAVGVTLPTTTTAGKVTYVGCVYNSQDTFWDAVAVSTQA